MLSDAIVLTDESGVVHRPRISRPSGCKNGLRRAKTQHMPLRKVGYVAFECVQRRFCNLGLGPRTSGHGHRTSILPRRVYRNKQFCAKFVYSNKHLHCWTPSSRPTSPARFRRQPIFTARLRNSSFWAVSLFLLMARSDRRSAPSIAVEWSGLDLSTQTPMPSYFQVWVTCRRWSFSS